MTVCTVKESIAAMTSWSFRRNAFHRSTFFCSSPWMRGAPHVGFPATILKMSSRSSLLMRFLPEEIWWRESQVQ